VIFKRAFRDKNNESQIKGNDKSNTVLFMIALMRPKNSKNKNIIIGLGDVSDILSLCFL
jgi:hypothetical protein